MPVDMVGVRLPSEIIKIIDMDIQEGEYISRSDWVRCACREFYEKRKRERAGGGALTHDRAVRRFKKNFLCTFLYTFRYKILGFYMKKTRF